MKRILVTGAGGSAAFNFIKSLRDNPNNEKFYIVGTDLSKYFLELSDIDKGYVVPPVTAPEYIDILNDIIEKEKIDFLHSQPEQEVEFIARNKEKIHTKTMFPDINTINICQNKMLFNQLLKKKELYIPESYLINCEEDLRNGLEKILKTNEKARLRAIKGAGSKGALPIKDFDHGKMWIDYWGKMKGIGYGNFMISEFLPGNEYAFQSIRKDGELIMSQSRQRLEYLFGNLFVSGQSSSPSVAVTVHNDEINKHVTEIIKEIDQNATGIFCADLKTNKNGEIVIMEINAGRFFTTSYFFSKAGCNMPYYHTKMGLGENLEYKGPKYNCLPEDLYRVRMVDMGFKLIHGGEWKGIQNY